MHYRTEMHEERRRTIKTLLRRRKMGQQRNLELLGTGEERCQGNETEENRYQEQEPCEHRGRIQGARSKGHGREGGQGKHILEDQGLGARATRSSCILVSVPGKQKMEIVVPGGMKIYFSLQARRGK